MQNITHTHTHTHNYLVMSLFLLKEIDTFMIKHTVYNYICGICVRNSSLLNLNFYTIDDPVTFFKC